MLFALDAHAIGRQLTGNEVYARSLLAGMAALESSAGLMAYVSEDKAAAWIPRSVALRRVSRNPFLRLGCEFAMSLRRDRPDVLHVQYTSPVGCPVPVVVSVHDVSFLEHPEYFPPLRAAQLRWTVRRTVLRAARVVTESDFSRRQILRAYPELEDSRVRVVPIAASAQFRPVAREAAAARVRERFGIAGPFVLAVGDLQPRKNHIGLIAGFAKMAQARPQLRHQLVLAGKDTWYASRVREAARQSGAGERIRFTGWVSDEELLQLYNACDLFAFPSHYEGFGLPLLEAMACARAVACARTSAMPEVVDGAALLFDPNSPDSIAQALADLLLDAELRARMERLGLQRSASFNWGRSAERTLEIYHEVAEEAGCAGEQVGSAAASKS